MNRNLVLSIPMVMAFVSNAQMQFISHRGESRDAPENTLAAFNLAIDRNVSGFECDIYLTRDKQIVCIHDDNTYRVTSGTTNLSVTNSTLAELRALDVGSWKSPEFSGEKIPTLNETLALADDGFTLYVEIKQPASSAIIPYIKTAIEAEPRATPERIVFISFKESSISAIRAALPEYPAFWLSYYSYYVNTPDTLVSRMQAMNASGFSGYYNSTAISNRIADVLHDAGFSAHVWTVDDAEGAIFCNDYGMDSLTSNSARDMLDNVAGNSVPHGWLDNYPELLAENMHDYRAAAMAKTQKFDARGREMSVWEDYIAGTCPTNRASRFRCFLAVEDGTPVVTWSPDLGTNRIYNVRGKRSLDEDTWNTPIRNETRFFKVDVQMP